jgi:cbb3-type cytochrome oxidase maturation protein
MSVLFIVLPLALLASGLAVAAFIWASESGQLDDLTTPAYRAIEDDDVQPERIELSRTTSKSAPPP